MKAEAPEKLAEIARLRRESAELIERLMVIRDRMTELSLLAALTFASLGFAPGATAAALKIALE